MRDLTLAFPATAMPVGAVASALLAIQMKNLDALAAAQKAAMEGYGTLAKQQQEMLAKSMQGAADLPSTLLEKDPQAAVGKPFDALKSAILNSTAQANLLSELAAVAGGNVADILRKRLLASIDETKAALQLAVQPAKA